MQLPWDEHFHEIVVPAWQVYLAAEARLSDAVGRGDDERIKRCEYDALREGGAAAIYLHHFSDIVLRARPPWVPAEIESLAALRRWIGDYCTMLRTEKRVEDVALCGDIADALKHAVLTRNVDVRQIRGNDAVIALSIGYGGLPFGEGKYGGAPQVIVLANSGNRALSSVLQNVVDAWRRGANIELPALDVV